MYDFSLNIIANVLLMYSTLTAIIFVITYGVFSNWRATRVGKIYFYLMAFLAFYFGFAILSNLDPTFPGRQIARTVIYLGVSFFLTYQTVNLLVIQHKSRVAHKASLAEELEAAHSPKNKGKENV